MKLRREKGEQTLQPGVSSLMDCGAVMDVPLLLGLWHSGSKLTAVSHPLLMLVPNIWLRAGAVQACGVLGEVFVCFF